MSAVLRRTSTLRVLLAMIAAALPAAACSAGGDRPAQAASGPTVVDSGGVRIVLNQVPATGFPLFATLTPSPDLVLGEAGAGGGVAGAVTLPDGRIAVADAGSREIRFHDAGGGLIASVGGEGEGPGRFQSVSRIGHVASDTVWVADHRSGQMALVTPAGEAARFAFPAGLTVAGRYADDGFLMVPQWSPSLLEQDWVEGVRRDSASWGVWWPRGVAAAQTPDFPHDELMVLKGADGPIAAVPPFGRRTSRAVGADGFWAGDQVTFEIRRFRPDGQLVAILRLEGVDLTLTDALKASVRPPRSEGDTALVDRLWRGVPSTRPAYTRLLLDGAGNLWVAEHVAGTQPPINWLVFSPEGAALGVVTLPAGFEPLEIGTGHMLGVENAEGGGRVVRYGLAPRGG
ncbi:MAG TPA: hypothetical protein VLH75_11975 [Longimicrobiales bacterium]|nr:hypothetical protein [Longimicrobiales bacterium]